MKAKTVEVFLNIQTEVCECKIRALLMFKHKPQSISRAYLTFRNTNNNQSQHNK